MKCVVRNLWFVWFAFVLWVWLRRRRNWEMIGLCVLFSLGSLIDPDVLYYGDDGIGSRSQFASNFSGKSHLLHTAHAAWILASIGQQRENARYPFPSQFIIAKQFLHIHCPCACACVCVWVCKWAADDWCRVNVKCNDMNAPNDAPISTCSQYIYFAKDIYARGKDGGEWVCWKKERHIFIDPLFWFASVRMRTCLSLRCESVFMSHRLAMPLNRIYKNSLLCTNDVHPAAAEPTASKGERRTKTKKKKKQTSSGGGGSSTRVTTHNSQLVAIVVVGELLLCAAHSAHSAIAWRRRRAWHVWS